jgi:Tfp pilus assembly protein FimV
MLVVRVETDWYAHDTEFRYVLQPGEGISGTHHLPIGQVMFVPREEITLRECSKEELDELRASKEKFFQEKAANRVRTPYGLQYSPHYQQQSRRQRG